MATKNWVHSLTLNVTQTKQLILAFLPSICDKDAINQWMKFLPGTLGSWGTRFFAPRSSKQVHSSWAAAPEQVLKASSFNRDISYTGSLLSSVFSITDAFHTQARKETMTSTNCEPVFPHLCAYMNELSSSTRTNSHFKNKSNEFQNECELHLTTTQ